MFETIVALATPPLKSALAIIRLSGDDCFDIASKCFSKNIRSTKERTIYYGYVLDEDEKIDEVVLLAYVSPKSFTGENSVEIICHGSMLIVNQIIDVLCKKGARLAVNGEFSSRAFMNHKMDLIQAEAVNDMINATTKEAKSLSLLSLEGKASKEFEPIKNKLGELLSKIEVNIDYPEYEDIEQINKDEIWKSANEIIVSLDKVIEKSEDNLKYTKGVNVAIVGKPNVGKSSLLNLLINENKAIVTDIAGTTRDIVEGDINICGVPLHLIDTAGLRESDNKIEQIGIEKSKEYIDKSDLVLFLKDENEIDLSLYELVKNKKHIVVTNKADLIKNKKDNELYISVIDNSINSLIEKIKEELNIKDFQLSPSFTNVRQISLLKSIKGNLNLAINDCKDNQPIDLISVSLMNAYNASLDLLGESNKNDLTDEIFSRFCVGK